MDVNERYKTIDALIQVTLKGNSESIVHISSLTDYYYTEDIKGLVDFIGASNNALKKAAGEIVRLRRTLKNVANAYEGALTSHTKVEMSLIEELKKLQEENEELELRLSKLYMAMDKAEGV